MTWLARTNAAVSGLARASVSSSATSAMIMGKPTLAITGGWFLLMMSVGPNPAQLTISASAGRGVVENGSGAVIAVVIPEPVRRTRTSTNPAISSKVIVSDIGFPNTD